MSVLGLMTTWTLLVVMSVQHLSGRGAAVQEVASRVDQLHAEIERVRIRNEGLLEERQQLETQAAELKTENARLRGSEVEELAAPELEKLVAPDKASLVEHADLLDDGMSEEEIRLHRHAVQRQKDLGFAGVDWAGAERKHLSRRLAALMKISSSSTSGCFAFDVSSTTSVDMSGDNCNSNRCPPCHLLSGAAATFTVSACSSAQVVSGTAMSSQVMQYDFINTDTTNTIKVTDGTQTFTLGPKQAATAYCSTQGTNVMYFPSTTFCPSSCDAVTPSNEAGNTFSTVKHIATATTNYLTSSPPTANVVYNTAAACGANTHVCMSR